MKQPFKKHLFICTHQRDPQDPKGCCRARGSESIRDFFKSEIKKRGLQRRGLQGQIRANTAGCLDHCAFGPAVVVYPEGVWYRIPTLEDAQEVVESHLEGGKIVERLLIYK